MNPELHLFIIWSHAKWCENQIIEDIGTKFAIKRVVQLSWDPRWFSSNLSRFYGLSLPPGCEKEVHCGQGPLTLIIVQDDHPVYALRNTSKGVLEVNANMFDAKNLYRQWTGGGHLIHGTNTRNEFSHDLILLLGCDPATCMRQYPGRWNGTKESLEQDLIGTHGWNSIQEVFHVLNNSTDYVVLRNFECLPDQYHLELHGDIDLLCDNAEELAFILNAVKVFPEDYRVHYQVQISGKPVLFDFRYVGDDYYDERWEQVILKNRSYSNKGFFIPDYEDYFFSLLYHAAIHKPAIAKDYTERLPDMAYAFKIGHFSHKTLFNFKEIVDVLDSYMNPRGYRYMIPKDQSVYFNNAIWS